AASAARQVGRWRPARCSPSSRHVPAAFRLSLPALRLSSARSNGYAPSHPRYRAEQADHEQKLPAAGALARTIERAGSRATAAFRERLFDARFGVAEDHRTDRSDRTGGIRHDDRAVYLDDGDAVARE